MKKQTITSDFVRNALGDLRMTGRQLARILGVTDASMSAWKNGWTIPRGDFVLKIQKMVREKQNGNKTQI